MRRNWFVAGGVCLILTSSVLARDRVLMLVDSSLHAQCAAGIVQYEADVEANFNVDLVVATGSFNSWSHQQVRSYLQSQYNGQGLDGVILTGQIPYANWEQGFGTNKGFISAYYEDMDGAFHDNDSDGYYDYHDWGTSAGPEIWSCWMRPPSYGGEAANLNNFLAKTHAYYAAGMPVPQQSLLAGHSDYDGFMEGAIGSVAYSEKLFGAGNYDADGRGSDLASGSTVNNYLTNNAYGMFESSAHANSTYTAYDSGGLTSSNVRALDSDEGAIATFIYGCHSANFVEAPGTSSYNVNLAVAFPFSNSIGQVASGTTWSYGTEYREEIYEVLAKGGYVGEAWYELIARVDTPEHIAARYSDRDTHTELAGNNLIGNPFVVLYAFVGDCSGDQEVGDADLNILLSHFGQNGGWMEGDFNRDGIIDDCDLNLLLSNYGLSHDGGTVPEPATISLMAIGALLCLRKRRR